MALSYEYVKIGDGYTPWKDLPYVAGIKGDQGIQGNTGSTGPTGATGDASHEHFIFPIQNNYF